VTRRGEVAARIALVVVSIAVSLAALEIGYRAWRGGIDLLLNWPNRIAEHVRADRGWPVCSHAWDATLGWAPVPGFVSPHYNSDGAGYRLVAPVADKRPPILAVGDSFTAGDEVDDHESWPALLQGVLGRRVVNGGVTGYGVDQMVLRAERFVARERPAAIVLGFIADDLERNAFRRIWTVPKPWFELADGRLVQHPPGPDDASCKSLPFWRRMLGWSMLVETMVMRLRWQSRWLYEDEMAMQRGQGWTLGCPLIARLAELEVPVLVVIQYARDEWRPHPHGNPEFAWSRHVADCARQAGMQVLDSMAVLDGAVRAGGLDSVYREGHHSPQGNRIVAGAIAAKLTEMGI
jgi:hypothetical protein